jgi:hypothetical protein
MNAESTAPSRAEIVDELSKWTVGLGIITLALFPLAVPILVLTAVATLPLLLPALALGLLLGGVALTYLLVRGLGRLAIRVLLPSGTAGPLRRLRRPVGTSPGGHRVHGGPQDLGRVE